MLVVCCDRCRHWLQSSVGRWELRVADLQPQHETRFVSWVLRIHGTDLATNLTATATTHPSLS